LGTGNRDFPSISRPSTLDPLPWRAAALHATRYTLHAQILMLVNGMGMKVRAKQNMARYPMARRLLSSSPHS